VAAGIFGQAALGGLGGVSLGAQLVGTGLGVVVALVGGYAVYGSLSYTRETAERYRDRALAALSQLPASEAHSALEALAHRAVERRA
jgi:hypothetical protein